MGSISILNVALKEKSMGAKETKEFYFSVKQQQYLIKIECHLEQTILSQLKLHTI